MAATVDIARQVKAALPRHNVPVAAAGIAFYALLAIPAALTAVISISGLVLDESTVKQQVDDNLGGLPESARDLVGNQLESISATNSGGLALGLGLSILVALWSVSSALLKVIATLNVIHGVPETRKMLRLRALGLALTFGATLFIAAAGFTLAVLPAVMSEAGMGTFARWTIHTLRFPALGLAMAAGLSILYRVGPARPLRRGGVLSPGAVAAAVLWLVLSGLFSIYTATISSYNETYGSLGAVVILLMWLLLTSYTVLLGAEIDVARADETTTDQLG